MFAWRKSRASGQIQIAPFEAHFASTAAAIHAEGFARAWPQHEFARLAGEPACLGHAALGKAADPIMGFVLSQRVADEAEILTIAVGVSHRNRGIGRDLLLHHMPDLVRHGVQRLFLEVSEANEPALRLYKSFGFAEIGRRPSYYKAADGSTTTALMMRVELD